MYSVYVLRSEKDGNLYVGCTSNIGERIKRHSSGKVFSTKNRRPLTLIYEELFSDKYEAYRTERFYKSATGKRILKQRIEQLVRDRLTVGR